MAIIDIDKMFWEMKSTMINNFGGNSEDRFIQAKSLFLENVAYAIDKNKEDLIKEVREKVE